MKKLLNTLVFIAIMLVVYYLSFLVAKRLGLNESIYFDIYTACLFLLTIAGLTYKKLWSPDSIKRRPLISSGIIIVVLLVSTLFFRITSETYRYFQQISTTEGKHWKGKVFQSDPVLGHVPVKLSSALLNLEYNHKLVHSIPIKYDENGFRIPANAPIKTEIAGPVVLFLGCSFTEGADCYAEQTFPYLVGDSLKGTSLNAGTSSYGFSQMLLLARKLIPELKPDYVVVQYSPWLAQRATSKFAPTYGLKIPSPYFAKENDSIVIHPPCYSSLCFSLDWEYDTHKSKPVNFASFFFNGGFSTIAKDDLNVVLAKLNNKNPLSDIEAAERFFFNEVEQLTTKNNSKLIVVNLGDKEYTRNSHKLLAGKNASFAEADSLLWQTVNNNKKEYERSYYFWGWNGKDSVIIDKHPTAAAHSIIANSIMQTINKNQ